MSEKCPKNNIIIISKPSNRRSLISSICRAFLGTVFFMVFLVVFLGALALILFYIFFGTVGMPSIDVIADVGIFPFFIIFYCLISVTLIMIKVWLKLDHYLMAKKHDKQKPQKYENNSPSV